MKEIAEEPRSDCLALVEVEVLDVAINRPPPFLFELLQKLQQLDPARNFATSQPRPVHHSFLHAFQNKARKTSRLDIEVAKRRYRSIGVKS